MGIAEMQRHFTAYGSGQLPEFELRSFIRSALAQEPQLSPALMALTDAYRRANLIDAKLQSTINADIAEVTGPILDLTMVRSPRPNTPWISDGPAANSPDVHVATRGLTGPEAAVAPNTISNSLTTGTGSTGGSKWDVDALAEAGAPLYPGSVIRDRFVLVEELGRGGMGVVYKAFDRSRGDVKDRYVAIKVLNEDFKRHPLAVRALQREARKAQKLAHPNVVGVHDFDRDGGNVYMVMEFLSGRSLDQVLRDDGQGGIPLGPAMDIIKCLAAALSYAHQQDIVHCDFKPSNAFLTREGKIKVLDFGIARAAPSLLEKGDATLFDAGQLGAVSPAYASLEMLQREQPDVRDDVYAFACVAYELLTGCHPYQRLDAMKAFEMELQPRPIRKLSRAQWRALKQGLAFRRADRYPTIDGLAQQLIAPPSRAKLWATVAAACVAAVGLAALLVWKRSDVHQTAAEQPRAARAESSAQQSAAAGASATSGPRVGSDTTAGSDVGAVRAGTGVSSGTAVGSGTATAGSGGTTAGSNAAGRPGTSVGSGTAGSGGTTAGSNATGRPGTSVGSGPNTAPTAATTPGPRATWGTTGTTAMPGAAAGSSATPGSGIATRSGTTAGSGTGAWSATTAGSGTNTPPAATATPAPRPTWGTTGTTVVPGTSAGSSATAGSGITARSGTSAGSATTAGSGTNTPPAATTTPGPNAAASGTTQIDILKAQFETQAIAGDVAGATTTANKLTRVSAGSAYVTREIPHTLVLTYVHLAKTQLAGGQINAALQTLKDGRQKFGKAPELKDLEERYVAAANIYDRVSSAVVLNVNDMKRALEELKGTEGEEYDAVAQMLAQTLADRIADQRAANRDPVADKLTEAGKQIFPDYTGMLGRGRAGVLPSEPILINEQ
ncbi:MAG: serine/threonine protein kinase [Gammaproteobacteria bacterium]|nr:serine/threonine protein kinase [Gammaproteobacteria bacterium]